jgi:hypothetical protein
MIMRAPTDGVYRIYDLGNNQVLNGETNPLWPASSLLRPRIGILRCKRHGKSTAVLGAVGWDLQKTHRTFSAQQDLRRVGGLQHQHGEYLASGAVLGAPLDWT